MLRVAVYLAPTLGLAFYGWSGLAAGLLILSIYLFCKDDIC